MSFLCPCCAVGAAAWSDSLIFCVLVNELARRILLDWCAEIYFCGVLGGATNLGRMPSGAVYEFVRLRMVLRSQLPCESWLWTRVFQGFRLQASAVQGSVLGAIALRAGFTFQGPAPLTQRVGSRHVSARLFCTIRW